MEGIASTSPLDQGVFPRSLPSSNLLINGHLPGHQPGPGVSANVSRSDDIDVRVELRHLRHKLRVLSTFAETHDLLAYVPAVSDMEEARELQYRIERIENTCAKHGYDLHERDLLNSLEHIHPFDAPRGFGEWLYQTSSPTYDLDARVQGPESHDGHRQKDRPTRSAYSQSIRCPVENCKHYIYGFLTPEELAHHQTTHPCFFFSTAIPSSAPLEHSSEASFDAARPTDRPAAIAHQANHVQLPPLSNAHQKGIKRELPGPLYPPSELPGFGRQHHSPIDPSDDPLLPPLKRTRVGPSRLKSIGELKLLTGTAACMRCRLFKDECDSDINCAPCRSQRTVGDSFDVWNLLGCRRGPLSSLADIFVPQPVRSNWGQGHTPSISPLEKRRNINEYLESTYLVLPDAARVVEANLDFDDDFWWMEDPAVHSASTTFAGYHRQAISRAPPVLAVLASSRNMSGCTYNFWQLLKLSGLLSLDRTDEGSSFPFLYRAKLLLREILFLDLRSMQPSIRAEILSSSQLQAPDEHENQNRADLIVASIKHLLDTFDQLSSGSFPETPRQLLAAFFSLVMFSMARTILLDVSWPALHRDHPATPQPIYAAHSVVNAAYKAVVAIVGGAVTTLFDEDDQSMTAEDRELYNTASMILRRDSWQNAGIVSTSSFLLSLGLSESPADPQHGFLRRIEMRPHPGLTAPQPEKTSDAESAGWVEMSAASDRYSDGTEHTHSGSHDDAHFSHTARLNAHTQRLPPQRLFCKVCNECPEGFRGEHELRRHCEARHTPLIRRWVCTEPVDTVAATTVQPAILLSQCKACTNKKKYTAYYNAAAHLRRAHFNQQNGDKGSAEWPPMTILKDWMQEVRLLPGAQDDSSNSNYSDLEVESTNAPVVDDAGRPHPRSPPHDSAVFASGISVGTSPRSSLRSLRSPAFEPRSVMYPPPLAPVRPPSSIDFRRPTPQPQPFPTQQPPVPGQQKQPLPVDAGHYSPQIPPSSFSQTRVGDQQHAGVRPQSTPPRTMLSFGTFEYPRPTNRNKCPHPECGRVFKDLTAHMLTHMEERPEKCPIETCEYHIKGFARKYDKNRHALTHYKGTMVCPFCHGAGTDDEKAFNRADVFKRHLTTIHHVEQTPPNSKKGTVGSGGHRIIGTAGGNGTSGSPALCSICQNHFFTPQEFYEHLDDCVLNDIAPTAKAYGSSSSLLPKAQPSSTGAQTSGPSPLGMGEGHAGPDALLSRGRENTSLVGAGPLGSELQPPPIVQPENYVVQEQTNMGTGEHESLGQSVQPDLGNGELADKVV